MGYTIIAIWLSFGGFMADASAEEYVDSGGDLTFDLTVSERALEPAAVATIAFSEDGLVQLREGGSVTVNGVLLEGKPLMKQGLLGEFQVGYEYKSKVSVSKEYEFIFRRGIHQEEVLHTILPRTFRPHIPKSVSRSRDLLIPFDGSSLLGNERPVVIAESHSLVDSHPEWRVMLDVHVKGNTLIVPYSSIRRTKTGIANFQVGIISNQQPPGSRNIISYVSSLYALVEITD